MVASINASTSAGVVTTADTSGILQLQTASTAAVTIDANQRTAFVAGTAALPAITTTGDTNTGIFFPAADTIAFSEGGAEAMRIDSSGNVMVGATSSNYRLRAQGAVTDAGEGDTNVLQGLVSTTAQAAGVGPSLLFVATYDGSSGLAGMGSVAGIKENSTSGNYAGALKFMTRPNGSNLAERMRIDSSGGVWFRTTGSVETWNATTGTFAKVGDATYPIGTTAPGLNVILNRNTSTEQIQEFKYNATAVGNISVTGSATAYNTASDYRLKEDIAPMTGALAKVAQLKPVTYKWKVDGSDGEGFIAHELAEVCPQAVEGTKDAVDDDGKPMHQSIDTSFLVATLTAAIQELKAINDTQAETINALTARIVALETK